MYKYKNKLPREDLKRFAKQVCTRLTPMVDRLLNWDGGLDLQEAC